jgi:hypothetical protein
MTDIVDKVLNDSCIENQYQFEFEKKKQKKEHIKSIYVGNYRIQMHSTNSITIYTDDHEVYLDKSTYEDLIEIRPKEEKENAC